LNQHNGIAAQFVLMKFRTANAIHDLQSEGAIGILPTTMMCHREVPLTPL
jgi:hypothetical protein